MSVVLLVGNHLRHRYLVQKLYQQGLLAGLVVEQREEVIPQVPPGMDTQLASLFRRHFHERLAAETHHFGEIDGFPDDIPLLSIIPGQLNSAEVADFLSDIQARLLLSYGVHMLSSHVLNASPARYKWNLHGGLSPWYRGCITHFWPSYQLEPQMTGFTLHELTSELDHGPVIHQAGTKLVRGDGLHDLACRALDNIVAELPGIIEQTARNDIQGKIHNTSGRLWLARDWRPDHLRLIYDCYDNAIVDACLDGIIQGREPELVRLI